jgi:hypothetical protein
LILGAVGHLGRKASSYLSGIRWRITVASGLQIESDLEASIFELHQKINDGPLSVI